LEQSSEESKIMKDFKTFLHSQAVKARLNKKKKKKKSLEKDSSLQMVLPGEHRATQKMDPTADDPSTSTFSPRG